MITVIRKLYQGNKFFKRLLFPIKYLNDLYWKNMDDESAIKKKFKQSFRYELDLNNPNTLNEKIQWLKLFDRSGLHTRCADKIAVREYVKSIIGEKYLVPVYFTTKDVNDLSVHNMPNVPVIIKANHDSGSYKIIYDKEKVNWFKIQAFFKMRLKINYYALTKEWPYKNIEPTIIVEKLLTPKNGGRPDDYKLHCFNGEVKYIQLDFDRGTKMHTRNWYDTDWRRAPFYWASLLNNIETTPNNRVIGKPKSLELMIELAEKLCSPFPYVRVDFYDIDGKVYFGEITFYHDNGFRPITPLEWDKNLGDLITLPNNK